MSAREYDALVVGGGPAGLSAALWLARYRRRVRVLDVGHPRNRATWAVHGYPGLPDLPPGDLRQRLREQALGAGAEIDEGRAREIRGEKNAFTLALDGGELLNARRVLLAFGLRDQLPPLPGLEEAYGSSVFHCPDCDGPSMVGARVGVYGCDHAAAALALYLLTWAGEITLLTDGHGIGYDENADRALAAAGIAVRTERIAALEAPAGRLRRIVLADDTDLPLEALFFHLGNTPGSDLGQRLGCETDAGGHLRVDRSQETSVPGVFAAGDIVGPPYLAVSAAASGVRAALSLHRSLLPDERHI